MERERVAVVMWCEKLRISQLMSHFAKLSACFGVFFFFLLNSPKKNSGDSGREKNAQEGIMN